MYTMKGVPEINLKIQKKMDLFNYTCKKSFGFNFEISKDILTLSSCTIQNKAYWGYSKMLYSGTKPNQGAKQF